MDDFDIINEELIEQANNLHKYATNKVICEQNKFRKLDDEHIQENSEIKQLTLCGIDEKEGCKDIRLAFKDFTDKEYDVFDSNNVNINNEHLTLICKDIEIKEINNKQNNIVSDNIYKDTCNLKPNNHDNFDSISKEYEAIDFYNFEKTKEYVLFELNGHDKEDRMKIHKILKGHPQICSKTNTAGVMTIKLTRKTKRFIFTLKKINKDTTEACHIICSMLKVPYKNISFAGNKDKRAITYQQ
ncbi:multisubstrate pseudouridine synthase 7, partial [Conglomerata obtusa]